MPEFSQSTKRLLFLHNTCNQIQRGQSINVYEGEVHDLYAPNAAEFTEWLEAHGLTVTFDIPQRMYTLTRPEAAGLSLDRGE